MEAGNDQTVRHLWKAKERGCIAAQVDTLSFQAPDFYKKLGFEVAGNVAGISNSPERYFLLKKF